MEKILVTGCSGFIGMHLCLDLLKDNYDVIGIDNMNDYYDVNLKISRLSRLKNFKNFSFFQISLEDKSLIYDLFKKYKPNRIINLAAQAGVRFSLENPHAYIDSNIVGFMNILECARNFGIEGLIYASSSSVYGGNKKFPFSVSDNVDKPISIYAATKKSNELMAHSYTHLFGLHATGLRFFTVYGPWGRPDMAMYIFTEKIINGKPISIFNFGKMMRDFTYIDDIVEGIRLAMDKNYKSEVFNLGNNKSESIMEVVSIIENKLNKKAQKKLIEIQSGDVEKTYADIEHTQKKLGFKPKTQIKRGIPKFIDWYINYHKS
jgi:UDP-glucuronate 4-epimerase